MFEVLMKEEGEKNTTGIYAISALYYLFLSLSLSLFPYVIGTSSICHKNIIAESHSDVKRRGQERGVWERGRDACKHRLCTHVPHNTTREIHATRVEDNRDGGRVAVVVAGMFLLSALRLSHVSPFLYYQF